jgi:hypothetical protein
MDRPRVQFSAPRKNPPKITLATEKQLILCSVYAYIDTYREVSKLVAITAGNITFPHHGTTRNMFF